MQNRKKSVITPHIANGIAVLVSLVWAASFLADIFVPEYDVNPLVHFLMVIVAGAALNIGLSRNGKNGEGREG